MARTISQSLRAAVQRQETGEAIIPFITITHANLDPPIRVAGDGVDYVWQGETWTGFFFEVEMLSDDESPPRSRLTIQNVDRKIGDAVRALTSPPRLRIDLVAASEFDQTVKPRTALGTPVIDYTANHLFLASISVDSLQVTAEIVSWDYTQTTYPGRLSTQDRYPALFR